MFLLNSVFVKHSNVLQVLYWEFFSQKDNTKVVEKKSWFQMAFLISIFQVLSIVALNKNWFSGVIFDIPKYIMYFD